MVNLLSLPNELLLSILSYFEYDKHVLLNCALVCQRFSRITPALIFRHIEFVEQRLSLDNYNHLVAAKSGLDDKLLQRSIRGNSTLCDHVWSYGPVTVTPIGRGTMHHVSPQSLGALMSFTKLRRMHIYCSGNPYRFPPEEINDIFQAPQLGRITTITLTGYPLSRSIAAFMLLPRLKTLDAEGIATNELTSECGGLSGNMRRTGTLRQLTITNSKSRMAVHTTKLTCQTLSRLLSFTASLERLHINLPVNVEVIRFRPLEFGFTTSNLMDTFESVRETLKTLIFTVPWRRISETRGIPMDFSFFQQLSYLKVIGLCLFPLIQQGRSNRNEREGLCHLLPCSIETLHIECSPQAAVLYEYPSELELENMSEERYLWMFQFPGAKKTTLTQLRCVILSDEASPITIRVTSWKPPKHLADAFAEAEIELDVHVCIQLKV